MNSNQNKAPDSVRVGGTGCPGRRGIATGKAGWLRCVSAGWFAWGWMAVAAQLRPLAPEDLAARAEVVVVAKVDAIETVREGNGGMVSRVELSVRDVWKGAATNRLVLTQPGGTLGTRRVVAIGDAEYRLGEEVVVFAVRNKSGEWLTLELAQGKFHVERPGSGAPWVRGLFFGGDPEGTRVRPANRLPLTLDALGARVKGVTR